MFCRWQCTWRCRKCPRLLRLTLHKADARTNAKPALPFLVFPLLYFCFEIQVFASVAWSRHFSSEPQCLRITYLIFTLPSLLHSSHQRPLIIHHQTCFLSSFVCNFFYSKAFQSSRHLNLRILPRTRAKAYNGVRVDSRLKLYPHFVELFLFPWTIQSQNPPKPSILNLQRCLPRNNLHGAAFCSILVVQETVGDSIWLLSRHN